MSDSQTTLAELRRLVEDFVDRRDWHQFHSPKNLSMSMAIEAAELMEHFRWVKNDGSRDMLGEPKALAEIRRELADVLAFTLSFANAAGIDVTSALRAKMAENARKYPAEEYKGRY